MLVVLMKWMDVCVCVCVWRLLALVVARIVLLFSGEFINPGPLAGRSSSNWSGSCGENGRRLGCYDRCLLHLGSPSTRLWGDRTALSQMHLFGCSLDWRDGEMFTWRCLYLIYFLFFMSFFCVPGLFFESTLSVSTCVLEAKHNLHRFLADPLRLG